MTFGRSNKTCLRPSLFWLSNYFGTDEQATLLCAQTQNASWGTPLKPRSHKYREVVEDIHAEGKVLNAHMMKDLIKKDELLFEITEEIMVERIKKKI